MALFGSKKDEKSKKDSSARQKQKLSEATGNSTIITRDTHIEGTITGNDAINIDGRIVGDVKIKNNVIVSTNGTVIGNIQAPKVICSGKVVGNIVCDHLEVLKSSLVKSAIKADGVIVYGKIEGQIEAENVNIELDGLVTDKIQAKNVNISGTFDGSIACNLLSTKGTAVVKGGIYVKNISNQGGRIEGSIGQYKDVIMPEKPQTMEKIDKTTMKEDSTKTD